MPLNFPTSPTNGQQYTDDNSVVWEYNSTKGVWNKLRVDNEKVFSGGKLGLSSDVSLSSTLTAISFDDEEFDLESYVDLANNPSRLTIQRTGFYNVKALLSSGTGGTGASYTIQLRRNGTSVLESSTIGPNQIATIDEILLFTAGDYIEIWAKENSAAGTLLSSTNFTINRLGFAVGSSFSAQSAFSGVKTLLTTDFSLSSTDTEISWDTTEYNLNADINGNLYWDSGDATSLTIYTTGYYRIKGQFYADTAGNDNSYKVRLQKNSTDIHTSSFSPNEIIEIDETLQLNSTDILKVLASNSNSVGNITTDSYFQIIREGI